MCDTQLVYCNFKFYNIQNITSFYLYKIYSKVDIHMTNKNIMNQI